MFDHRDYDFFVDENLPAGQVVGTVQATDLDPTVPNNKLTYAVVPGKAVTLALFHSRT